MKNHLSSLLTCQVHFSTIFAIKIGFNLNSACVNCLIEFQTSYKVSVSIAGDFNSIGTLEVMVAPSNVLCVFNFCIELIFIVFDQYWNCILCLYIRAFQVLSFDLSNWTQPFFSHSLLQQTTFDIKFENNIFSV